MIDALERRSGPRRSGRRSAPSSRVEGVTDPHRQRAARRQRRSPPEGGGDGDVLRAGLRSARRSRAPGRIPRPRSAPRRGRHALVGARRPVGPGPAWRSRRRRKRRGDLGRPSGLAFARWRRRPIAGELLTALTTSTARSRAPIADDERELARAALYSARRVHTLMALASSARSHLAATRSTRSRSRVPARRSISRSIVVRLVECGATSRYGLTINRIHGCSSWPGVGEAVPDVRPRRRARCVLQRGGAGSRTHPVLHVREHGGRDQQRGRWRRAIADGARRLRRRRWEWRRAPAQWRSSRSSACCPPCRPPAGRAHRRGGGAVPSP